jgi:hypothetical protein
MAASSLGDPQSLNMFAYVQNMPTDFVDPSGLQRVCFYDAWSVCGISNDCETEYVESFCIDLPGGGWGGGPIGLPGGGPIIGDGPIDGGGTGGNGEDRNETPPSNESSCERFANEVARLAAKYPNALPSQFANLLWKRFAQSGKEFSDDGFKERFRDDSNQARHYVGGFWAGFTAGETLGTIGADLREDVGRLVFTQTVQIPGSGVVIPLPTGIAPASESNKKDKALNAVSARHGGMLNSQKVKPADLAELIRREVCE